MMPTFTAPLNCLTTLPISPNALHYDGNDWEDLEPEQYQKGLEINKLAREKIVQALGGPEKCETYPVYTIANESFHEHISLTESCFPPSQDIIQGEDPAGRKYVGLRLFNKELNIIQVETIYQRYRETCVTSGFTDGKVWCGRIYVGRDLEGIVKFITEIFNNKHPTYQLASKII